MVPPESVATTNERAHGLGAVARRRFVAFVAVSVALHVPLLDLSGWLGVIDLFGRRAPIETAPALTEIPIDIVEVHDRSAPQPAATTPPEGQPPQSLPPAQSVSVEPLKRVIAPRFESKPDAPAVRVSTEPVAVKGAAARRGAATVKKRQSEPNANVRILLHSGLIRAHALGQRIEAILSSVRPWRGVFGAAAISPVRDVERMLILGAELHDPRSMTLVMELNLPGGQLRAAIDRLVSLDPEGTWSETTVPVATARPDGDERVFVLPSPGTLLVAPPASRAAAERFSSSSRLAGPQADELASLFLATPWRVLARTQVTIPKTIQWVRLRLALTEPGGAVIHLVARDESEALADSNVRALERAARTASKLELGSALLGAGRGAPAAITFSAVGKEIHGALTLDGGQVSTLLNVVQSMLGEQTTTKVSVGAQ